MVRKKMLQDLFYQLVVGQYLSQANVDTRRS